MVIFEMETKDDSSVLTDNEQEITSLQEILDAFGAPLNEEQAWALCYQCGKYVTENKSRKYFGDYGASGVLLAKDGTVYLSTPQPADHTGTRRPLGRAGLCIWVT